MPKKPIPVSEKRRDDGSIIIQVADMPKPRKKVARPSLSMSDKTKYNRKTLRKVRAYDM